MLLGMKWTETAIEKLKAGVTAGKSAKQIAADFSEEYRTCVTRNTVAGKIYRLQLMGPKSVGRRNPGTVAHGIKHRIRRLRRARQENQLTVNGHANSALAANIKSVQQRRAHQGDGMTDLPHFPDAPAPLLTSLLDLSDAHCHWPEKGSDDNCVPLYCGHPAAEGLGRPYCEFHASIMFRPFGGR